MSIDINSVSLSINEIEIINNISLKIEPGQLTTILGPNGSGKSTLLKIISGDILPSKGSISMDTISLNDIGVKQQALKRSVMSQSQQVLYDYSVEEIIEMGWVDDGNVGKSDIIKQKCRNVAKKCSLNFDSNAIGPFYKQKDYRR